MRSAVVNRGTPTTPSPDVCRNASCIGFGLIWPFRPATAGLRSAEQPIPPRLCRTREESFPGSNCPMIAGGRSLRQLAVATRRLLGLPPNGGKEALLQRIVRTRDAKEI